jgi:DNA-binding winged helix-turn-helix (wHTH) protein/Tol biopolymer transport system component
MSLIRQGLFKFGPFTLNAGTTTLRQGEQLIPLPPKIFDTLLALVERRGEVVTKDQLMKALWPDSFVEESNLVQNVFVLRRALGRASNNEEYIQTIPKRGYRISVPVEDLAAPDASPAAVIQAQIERPRRSFSWRLKGIAAAGALGAAGFLIILLWQTQPARPTVASFIQLTRDGADKHGLSGPHGGPDGALATDGSRVYFTAGTQGSAHISQVSAAGGETVNIPLPFRSAQLLDFSPVRSELLVAEFVDPAAETPLWAVSVPAGSARRVGRLSARDAAWSRDGHRIALVRGMELYLSDEYGAEQRKLADLPGLGWRPRWSPGDRSLRLTIVDPKHITTSIWEIAVDTGRARPLLPNWNTPAAECCGEWTADGKRYFFQATRSGKSEIWDLPSNRGILGLFAKSRGAPLQITGGQMNSLAPVPSPDGRSLFVIGRQGRGELERYDAASHRFIPYLGGIPADFIDFSRDGRWMTYVLLPEGTLWRSKIDGSERLQLTFPPGEVMVPHWSPDGRQIVFHAMGGGRHQQIYIVSREGGQPEIVPGSTGAEMHPTWSPDGKALMYSDYPFFGASPNQVAVHTLDLRTRQVKTLPGLRGIFSPTWSPDGRYATALTLDGQRIMIFDFETQSWSELANGWGIATWAGDGRYVYYLRYGPQPAILRICIQDRRIQEVASLAGIHQAGRLAGIQFALAPDGSPVVLRDTGTEEIYSVNLQAR